MKEVNGVISISYNRNHDIKKNQSKVKIMHWFIMLVVILLTVSFTTGQAFANSKLSQKTTSRLKELYNIKNKIKNTPLERKISINLLLAEKIGRGELGYLPWQEKFVVVKKGLVEVELRTFRVTKRLLDEIVAERGKIIHSSPEYNRVRALVPLKRIKKLAALKEVKYIGQAIPAITNRIDNRTLTSAIVNKIDTSEGDVAHNADTARTGFGVDGTGVKIGVLSDGVKSLAALQETDDLPGNVTVLPNQKGPKKYSEGTALLEIIHDLAPGAELFFATAFNGKGRFARNIIKLRRAGCDIIVDDVLYLNESPFQDDIIAQAVNEVTEDGALYFSAAGNGGNFNDGTSGVWEGDYQFGENIGGPFDAHDFGGGDIFNQITENALYGISLFWSDPLDGASNDYDLCILDASLRLLGCSLNTQNGNDDPFEYIPPFVPPVGVPIGYNLLILNFNSAEPRYLHLNTFRGRLEHNTDGQTLGHSAAVDAFSVAAVNVADAGGAGGVFNGTESVETFSSDGLRRMFYEADGTPITPGNFLSTGGEVRQKPDIAAADGVSTATPGSNPFLGTSAAAPHAAAIAGLLLSTTPGATPQQARQAIISGTLDIEDAGIDRDSGSGIVMADLALGELPAGGSCGNGVVDLGEECDDGNSNEDDDCDSSCIIIKPKSFFIRKAVLKERTDKTDIVNILIKKADDLLLSIISRLPNVDLNIKLESGGIVFYEKNVPGSSFKVNKNRNKAVFKEDKARVTLSGIRNRIVIKDNIEFLSAISNNDITLTIETVGDVHLKYEFSGTWEENPKKYGKLFRIKKQEVSVSP